MIILSIRNIWERVSELQELPTAAPLRWLSCSQKTLLPPTPDQMPTGQRLPAGSRLHYYWLVLSNKSLVTKDASALTLPQPPTLSLAEKSH